MPDQPNTDPPDEISASSTPPSGAPPQRTTGGNMRWTPPSPEHLQRMLPQYEVLAIIGHGGMGAVYQAKQISLDRLVAIKILPPEAADDEQQFIQRFKNEARTMAKMLLLNKDGAVKVADFGLAKMHDPSLTAGLTQSGKTMGTPDFVAPEALILGVVVDHRADLYAIGVMLYQMLTGKIPRGSFKMPTQVVPGLDKRFDAIVHRAMQEDREERYQSAQEIRSALDVILTTPELKVETAPQQSAPPARKPVARGPQPRNNDVRSAAAQPSVAQRFLARLARWRGSGEI